VFSVTSLCLRACTRWFVYPLASACACFERFLSCCRFAVGVSLYLYDMGSTPSKPNIDPKYLYPTSLQGKCEWPPNALKAIIFVCLTRVRSRSQRSQGNKLAPFYPGAEEQGDASEECPICFLVRLCFLCLGIVRVLIGLPKYFDRGLNVAECCKKRLCSECFVQVKRSPIRNATYASYHRCSLTYGY
jgi:hypothetical protein